MDRLSQRYKMEYEVRTADIDERALRDPEPRKLVLMLAHQKALAIKSKMQGEREALDGLLVTCDQVVTHEERILEKPLSIDEAEEFIDGYGRAPASTVGATVVTNLSTGCTWESVDTATIHFRPFPGDVRDRLIDEGEVFYCAGGLMIEHPLVTPHILRLDGSEDTVMGLSAATVTRLLLQAMVEGGAAQ